MEPIAKTIQKSEGDNHLRGRLCPRSGGLLQVFCVLERSSGAPNLAHHVKGALDSVRRDLTLPLDFLCVVAHFFVASVLSLES